MELVRQKDYLPGIEFPSAQKTRASNSGIGRCSYMHVQGVPYPRPRDNTISSNLGSPASLRQALPVLVNNELLSCAPIIPARLRSTQRRLLDKQT